MAIELGQSSEIGVALALGSTRRIAEVDTANLKMILMSAEPEQGNAVGQLQNAVQGGIEKGVVKMSADVRKELTLKQLIHLFDMLANQGVPVVDGVVKRALATLMNDLIKMEHQNTFLLGGANMLSGTASDIASGADIGSRIVNPKRIVTTTRGQLKTLYTFANMNGQEIVTELNGQNVWEIIRKLEQGIRLIGKTGSLKDISRLTDTIGAILKLSKLYRAEELNNLAYELHRNAGKPIAKYADISEMLSDSIIAIVLTVIKADYVHRPVIITMLDQIDLRGAIREIMRMEKNLPDGNKKNILRLQREAAQRAVGFLKVLREKTTT